MPFIQQEFKIWRENLKIEVDTFLYSYNKNTTT